jgi:hypothetical protein
MIASAVAVLGLICAVISAQAQSLSTDELACRVVERRAIEAVVWGMPAVNFERM